MIPIDPTKKSVTIWMHKSVALLDIMNCANDEIVVLGDVARQLLDSIRPLYDFYRPGREIETVVNASFDWSDGYLLLCLDHSKHPNIGECMGRYWHYVKGEYRLPDDRVLVDIPRFGAVRSA